MRLAVLIYGQPRFFEKTADIIKKEFEIPGWQTDFFIHNWENVGHTPACDENNDYDEKCNQVIIQEKLNPITYNIESYDIIYDYAKKYIECIKQLTNRKVPYGDNYNLERYFFGQHISTQKCYESIKLYEDINNFQYDIIIKARTDIIYTPSYCYSTEEEYVNHKKANYSVLINDRPVCHANGIRYNTFNNTENKWEANPLKYFYENKMLPMNLPENKWYNEVEYKWGYWDRLLINDWSLVCNRLAAEVYYNKWFDNLFLTLGKDLLHNNLKTRWMSRSEHTLQGELTINNKVECKWMGRRRDKKIISAEKIKEDVTTSDKILLYRNDCIKTLHNKIREKFPDKIIR